MTVIVYSLLFIYSLPLFSICFSIYVTDFFIVRGDDVVYMADAISSTFFSLFRDSFGSIIIPLVTAYSIPIRQPNQPIPRQTLYLFFTLMVIFLLAMILYAVVSYHHIALDKYYQEAADGKLPKDVFKAFVNTITAYGKESLAYVALLLGLSLKKGD